jgi:hypothetical protein
LLFNDGIGGIRRIAVVAVLLDTSNEIAGGGVLEEEVHCHRERLLSVKEACLLQGERPSGIVTAAS